MSHFNWLLAGTILATIGSIPVLVQDIAVETEALGTKIKQNLELAEQYHDNMAKLDGDIKHLNDVAQTFAMGYGANVKDVMDMMQVLSRRFKSPEEITYYTNMALIMHKLDFVEPKKAAEDLEATILGMGLNFEQSKKFIDEFSVAVHSARITGTELLSGLQRAGATFHNMNFNTAQAIAMISTLSTVTAKAGANIGASLNSVLINIDFKKAAQALKAYNIQVYETVNGQEKMRDGAQVWRDIAQVFNGLDPSKANEFANAMSGGKFRANDLRALLSNWKTFEQILTDIQSKASPELTAKLLQTSMETTQTKLHQLQAALQVFGITVGENVLPALKEMTIGLTEGVQWLNQHKEAVHTAINVIAKFVEGLVMYKGIQLLANSALGKFVENLLLEIRTAPTFNAAMNSMKSSTTGFAKSLGLACVKMAAFYAMAEALNRVMAGRSQGEMEREFAQDTAGAGSMDAGAGRRLSDSEIDIQEKIKARDEYVKNNALSTGNNGITGKWALFSTMDKTNEFNRLNNKVTEALQKRKAENSLTDVNKMVEEAEKLASQHGNLPTSDAEHISGEDIGSSGGKGGSPTLAPNGNEYKVAKDNLKALTNTYSALSQVLEDRYATALDIIKEKEDLQGQSLNTIDEKINLNSEQWKKLQEQKESIANNMGDLDKSINGNDFQTVAGVSLAQYKTMSKEQRGALQENIRDTNQENSLLLSQMEAYNKLMGMQEEYNKKQQKLHHENEILREKTRKDFENKLNESKSALENGADTTEEQQHKLKMLELGNKLNTVGNTEIQINQAKLDIIKEEYSYKIKVYDLQMRMLDADKQLAIYKLGYNASDGQKRVVELDYARQELETAQGEFERLKNDATASPETLKKQELLVAKWKNNVDELSNYTKDKIHEGLGGIADELLIQGNSWKDISKRIWKEFGSDALKAILGIKHEASLLGNIFGGNGSAGANGGLFGFFGKLFGGGTPKTAHTGEYISGYPKMHGGGNVLKDDEVVRTLQVGERVLSKKDNQMFESIMPKMNDMLSMGRKLSPTFGQQFEPYLKNPDLVKNNQIAVEVRQNAQHIQALERQNQLMMQQNQMIADMAKNGGNGNITVVQAQATDEAIIQALSRNPSAVQAILARNSSWGYR